MCEIPIRISKRHPIIALFAASEIQLWKPEEYACGSIRNLLEMIALLFSVLRLKCDILLRKNAYSLGTKPLKLLTKKN